MNLTLWIVQILLAAAFIPPAIMKAFFYETFRAKFPWPWARDVGKGLVVFIGISELLGGIGLILPWATGIMPGLTPLAACGLALIMLLAALFHAKRREPSGIVSNVILGGLAAFVAWGRF
jgi:uncharacterized membrane protein YphA (DoxX/SURF4 family)